MMYRTADVANTPNSVVPHDNQRVRHLIRDEEDVAYVLQDISAQV